MPWVRLDDHFDEHRKLARVGPLGLALWVTGLAYCNRNLTDGRIPWTVARSLVSWEFLGPTREDGRRLRYTVGMTSGHAGDDASCAFAIELLVEAGLWEETADGYLVHDYLDYNPSRARVLAQRAATAERVGAWRARQRNAVTNGQSNSVGTHSPVPNPVPVPLHAEKSMPATDTHDDAPRRRAPVACSDDDFSAWWTAYPRHEAKKAARTAYLKRVHAGRSAAALLAAAQQYATHVALGPTPTDKIAHATTFLNQHRDEDWEHGPPDADRAVPRRTWVSAGVGRYFPDYRSSAQKALEPVPQWREINWRDGLVDDADTPTEEETP